FLRKRFSAASWACDLTAAATKRATSEQRRTSVPATARKRDRLIVAAIRPDQCGRSRCVRALLGTGPIRPKLRRTAFLRTTGWEVDLRLVLTDDCEHRERRKAPVSTKTAAQRWGEEREREWYYALTHPQPQTPPKEVPTLDAFWSRFIDGYAQANRQQPSGVAAKATIGRVHLIPMHGGTLLGVHTD